MPIDLHAIRAIDVHVHAEVSCHDPEDPVMGQFFDAASAYFKAPRERPKMPEIAELYREQRIAFCLFTVDCESHIGARRVSNYEIAEFAAANSDICIPFASIDPHKGKLGAREARDLVENYGVRGFKFHHIMQGIDPAARVGYPIYEVIAEHGLPAIFHTGHSGMGTGMRGGGGVRLKYGQPMLVDDVAVDFPDMKIILAHPSWPWVDESLSMALHKHSDGQKDPGDDVGVIEGVVSARSALVGSTAGRLMLKERMGLHLVAIAREGERLRDKPRGIPLQAGDVIVLQGHLPAMPGRLRQLGVLPLAERAIRLGQERKGWLAVAILATAMAATATGLVPVAMAFFAGAAMVVITGALSLDDAYSAIEWPILIMLGALIPVSETLQSTGASGILATELARFAVHLPAWGAVVLVLLASMAVTPFLNNAATVLVMAPIAAVFAHDLGYRPDAFLMATAIGAGCDFLTPIGHQCNTLVLGPGGYRFGDYARLGAPLSLLVLVIGTPLIMAVWPLR